MYLIVFSTINSNFAIISCACASLCGSSFIGYSFFAFHSRHEWNRMSINFLKEQWINVKLNPNLIVKIALRIKKKNIYIYNDNFFFMQITLESLKKKSSVIQNLGIVKTNECKKHWISKGASLAIRFSVKRSTSNRVALYDTPWEGRRGRHRGR